MRRSWWLGLVGVGVGTLVLMGISPAAARDGTREHASPGAGTWQTVVPMHQARSQALAVRLTGGRVLVIGGASTPRTAEVYRVASGRWVPTGSMTAGADEACAVRLADGHVLVAGGVRSTWHGPQAMASAQLYNPATRTWSRAANLHVPREGPACVRLRDGRVLVAGGWGRPEATAVRSAELFDPRTGRWTLTDPLLVRHGPSSAVLLRNGDVLLAGGFGDQADPQSDAERYVVATGTWRAAGSLSEPRFAPLFRLPGGRVVAIGGWGLRASARVDLFRPAHDDWVIVEPLPGPRASARLSSVAGLPLVLGGYDRNRVRASVFQYQTDGSWLSIAPLPRRLAQFVAVLLPDGRTLVAGGQTARPDPPPVRYAAIFTPG